jgi:hypothetical protein
MNDADIGVTRSIFQGALLATRRVKSLAVLPVVTVTVKVTTFATGTDGVITAMTPLALATPEVHHSAKSVDHWYS